MRWDDAIKVVTSALCSLATFLWGRADWWIYALIALLVLDFISGLSAAYIEGTRTGKKGLSSKKCLAGILKKVMYLLVVSVGHIVDTAINGGGAIRALVIGFLMGNEGLSIIENCARCGLPIPKKLVEALEQLRGDVDTPDGK